MLLQTAVRLTVYYTVNHQRKNIKQILTGNKQHKQDILLYMIELITEIFVYTKRRSLPSTEQSTVCADI